MTDQRPPPRYPIYIPTKGRADSCFTAKFLLDDGVPFFLVVEPQERRAYAERFGEDRLLVLPFREQGLAAARNWIKAHSVERGDERHWQLDDNISRTYRTYKGERLYCHSGIALRVAEDFADRYENVAIAGLNYTMFAVPKGMPPYYLNCHVYSCSLFLNALPNRWRGINDDVDICLQVLADGWCTVLVNVFTVQKRGTMTVKGGQTDKLYSDGDGRLKLSRWLERRWPGVVTTGRRFKRPQAIVKYSWQKFDTPLKLKPGVDLSKLPPVDEYGMKLVQKRPAVKSEKLREFMREFNAEGGDAPEGGQEA